MISMKTAPAHVHITKITYFSCLYCFVHILIVLFPILCCLTAAHHTKLMLLFWISDVFILIDIPTKSLFCSSGLAWDTLVLFCPECVGESMSAACHD